MTTPNFDRLVFLNEDDVVELHSLQHDQFGGATGLRDVGLLQSACAQPIASFGGHYLHESLASMAAAYLYHLVSNHPFLDGNKRIGLLTSLVFLELNAAPISSSSDDLYNLTIGVANGQITKEKVIEMFSQMLRESSHYDP